MRRGEILALRWCDLDDSLETARVRRSLQTTRRKFSFEEPKTRRSRRAVTLPEILRPYLVRQRDEQAERREASTGWQDLDLVIDRGDGGPVNPTPFPPPGTGSAGSEDSPTSGSTISVTRTRR
jgi:integrase